MEAQIVTLQQLYLVTLVQMFKAEKLHAILQDFGQDAGRLWLTGSEGTTIPQAELMFKFDRDSVALRISTRDERTKDIVVKYAEGLDGAMEQIQKLLRAGRIGYTGPKAVA